LNVAFNLFLVPRYGLFGASAMTVITEVVLVGQYAWILRDVLRQLDWQAIILRPLTAALIMGGVLMISRDLPLPLTVLLGGLTYGGLGLALGVLGKTELDLLRNMRQKTATPIMATSSAIPVLLESATARRGAAASDERKY
jgi:O-antigen/teichoic acid export membrane protein